MDIGLTKAKLWSFGCWSKEPGLKILGAKNDLLNKRLENEFS